MQPFRGNQVKNDTVSPIGKDAVNLSGMQLEPYKKTTHKII